MIVKDRRELRRRLVAVASAQSGYFSAAQALRAGYSYQAQKQNADRGNWLKVGRGVFRLPEWPPGRREDLVRLALWSHGRAVVSHESALSVHELGDVNPARIHLTVPPGFRQRVPEGVVLHRAELPAADVREQEGFRVTTPLRSLLDAAAGDLDLDLLAGAIEDALEQGLLTRARLLARADQAGPTRNSKLSPSGSPASASIRCSRTVSASSAACRRARSRSRVLRARSPRRTSSAMPPLSTHWPGMAWSSRTSSRSNTARRRSRSSPVAVARSCEARRASSAARSAPGVA